MTDFGACVLPPLNLPQEALDVAWNIWLRQHHQFFRVFAVEIELNDLTGAGHGHPTLLDRFDHGGVGLVQDLTSSRRTARIK
ncbi:MAG TPA: hypothetical protein VFE60_10890 [Roseiarcus sp.]|nr:hypothetical protein [Roseiarcus sp.]